jgi:hypothetical protein
MERFLSDYIERMRPLFSRLPANTAHEIASGFLSYKFGLYSNAVRECTHAISLLPDTGDYAPLKKALSIVGLNAQGLENAQVSVITSLVFSREERKFVAIVLPEDKIEDPASFELDNALIMVYAAAVIASPDDEQALEEHRRFVILLLTGYKKALNLE